ncbi:MAG: sel1 repeat family protein [Planctomycetes bacterium]|nr:sel1 repeat family protein [Planctomycetota bacterium]
MVSLGQQLAKGHGVAKDEKQALTWFQRAARDDAPAAHTALGVAYAEGSHGAERDLKLARRHLERARKLGQAEASFRLGQLHNRGVFGTRDAKFATELLVEAGERGYAAAWLYLGRCYEAVSARNAVYYYRLGLEAGDEEASQALLLLLRKRPEFREDDDPREVIDPTRR